VPELHLSLGIAELERLAARSWQGLEEERYGDWLLRSGGGFTGRANSVLVVGNPADDLTTAVATVTRWYAERGLRPRAQVPMPGAEDADAALAAAGWTRDDDNLVLTAPLAAVAHGVLVDGWLCVTAVTVDERHRRRGLATAVMAGLAAWARERGAHSCVLQVAGANTPALTLYQRLGFTEHHRYHYRLGTAVGPGPS
jgi:ribosomal protein S18 acetylase RimI-like enzyme